MNAGFYPSFYASVFGYSSHSTHGVYHLSLSSAGDIPRMQTKGACATVLAYSSRNTRMGSVCAACSAGTRVATAATAITSRITPPKVLISKRETP